MLKEHAVIFDLDGTLLNTLDDLTASVNAAMKAAGLKPHSREEVRQYVGNGVMKLIERCVPDGKENPQFKKAYGAFRMHYAAHCRDKTAPYDGIIQLLGRLRAQGVPVAVVSNKFDSGGQKALRRLFCRAYPGGHRRKGRRPPETRPDTVLEALRALGMTPEKAIYVGDSEVDIETAKNAGTEQISVCWGFKSREFLEEHGAKRIVENADELYQLLEKMTYAPAGAE